MLIYMITPDSHNNGTLQAIALEGERVQAKLKMISEGIELAEWPHIKKLSKGKSDDTAQHFLSSLKELHCHVEACLQYVNALNEEQGIMVMNDY